MGANEIDGIPYHIDNAEHYVGREIGVSDWFPVSQARVVQFGEATEDFNPIHVNPDWSAAHSPFGGPIAHGFFTLSLLSYFSWSAGLQPEGIDYGVNVGFDRVRLLAPVMVDDHIRMRATLLEVIPRGENRWQFKNKVVVETQRTKKVALNAVWITLLLRDPEGGKILAYSGGRPEDAGAMPEMQSETST